MFNKLFITALGILLVSPLLVTASSLFNVQQGGTGAGTFSSSQLLYGAGTSPLKTVATSSLGVTSPITFSGTLGAQVGGGGGSFACATCLTANQTITLSGAVTGTGATTITTAFGTAAANTVLANNTSATAIPTFIATSSLFTFSAGLSAGNILQQVEHPSFTYATSTAWTGTTTIPLQVGYGEVWNSVRCVTDAGTLGVDFYHSTSHLDYIPTASTTKNTFTFATNATITDGDTVKVDVGTPASSPTKITCTVKDTY